MQGSAGRPPQVADASCRPLRPPTVTGGDPLPTARSPSPCTVVDAGRVRPLCRDSSCRRLQQHFCRGPCVLLLHDVRRQRHRALPVGLPAAVWQAWRHAARHLPSSRVQVPARCSPGRRLPTCLVYCVVRFLSSPVASHLPSTCRTLRRPPGNITVAVTEYRAGQGAYLRLVLAGAAGSGISNVELRQTPLVVSCRLGGGALCW